MPIKPGARRDSFSFLLVGGGFVAIVPPALIHFVSPEQVLLSSKTHFWSVVASSLVATAAGVALSYGGWRRGDARAVLVGTAFTVMASLLLVHGLASPGFIFPKNGVISLTAAPGPASRPLRGLPAAPCASRRQATTDATSIGGVLPPRPRAARARPETNDLMASTI